MKPSGEDGGASGKPLPAGERRPAGGKPRRTGRDGERMLVVGGDFNRARYSISPMAEDFRVFILALLQPLLAGHPVSEPVGRERMDAALTDSVTHTLWGDVVVRRVRSAAKGLQDRFNFVIPLQFFARGRRGNGRFYSEIRSALKELGDCRFTVVDNRGDLRRETYTGIISAPEIVTPKDGRIDGREAYVSFDMMGMMIEAMLDGRAGFYRFFESEVAALGSVYAKRIYEMLCSSPGGFEMRMGVGLFKERFCIEDKYPRMVDLRRFVLEPAVAEINASTSLTIRYGIDGARRGAADRNITFTVLRNAALLSEGELARAHPVWPGAELSLFLRSSVRMTEAEMRPHLMLLDKVSGIPAVMGELRYKWEKTCQRIPSDGEDAEKVRRARIRHFIQTMRGMLADYLAKTR